MTNTTAPGSEDEVRKIAQRVVERSQCSWPEAWDMARYILSQASPPAVEKPKSDAQRIADAVYRDIEENPLPPVAQSPEAQPSGTMAHDDAVAALLTLGSPSANRLKKAEAYTKLYDHLTTLQSSEAALRERLRELEEALRPFATLGSELGDGVWETCIWKDDTRIDGAKAYRDGVDYFITVGDLRRASQVLKEGK